MELHGQNVQTQERPERSSRNARLGLYLFAPYSLIYAGFVLLNAFSAETMQWSPFWGLNLSVIYGFALIALAFVVALVYGWICRAASVPNETNHPVR